ncbi:MurR/RpiR family transcriptional regulator [Saccharopolyspora sp. HNM0983]|uniref:MurR/RpiR family transcriptional regulator n=1 Tax=Saccharopolyspora montiporae TaxID=2781240 RepID=A0A929B6P4_9PSEU|nr:MurR/RpiR family transcriptional regulator [Saccharopolyspora sp. HNM0983]
MGSDATSSIGATSPLVTIRSLLPGLARAEQRVAKIVLDGPETIARRSITEVAEAAATSETTVTRFCKAIGVGGYPDLRIALAAETARASPRDRRLGGDIEPDDDLAAVVAKVGYADAMAVEETVGQLDRDALQRVVDAIGRARRIDIYGVGASAFVALDLQQKLHRIGLTCFAWSDTHNALTSAAVLGQDDLAIGISHSGATSETGEALRQAARSGATTAVLTNFARSPLTEVVDEVLTTAVRESGYRSGAMASRIGQLAVVDCLFVAVAQSRMERTESALEATFEAVRDHRLDARPDRRRHREQG